MLDHTTITLGDPREREKLYGAVACRGAAGVSVTYLSKRCRLLRVPNVNARPASEKGNDCP